MTNLDKAEKDLTDLARIWAVSSEKEAQLEKAWQEFQEIVKKQAEEERKKAAWEAEKARRDAEARAEWEKTQE